MGLHQCFPTAALGNTKASSGFVKCYLKVSNSSSKRKTKNEIVKNSTCSAFNSTVKSKSDFWTISFDITGKQYPELVLYIYSHRMNT